MSESLALVLDSSDVDAIATSGVVVDVFVACDPEVHIELRRSGVRHITPWDLIDGRRLAELRRFEQEVIAFWRANAHANFDGVNLLGCADFRHAGALSRIIWCHAVIDAALRRARPRRAVVVEQPPRHGLSQPPELRSFPLLQSMFAGAAERLGMDVIRCSTAAPPTAFEDAVVRHREPSSPPGRDELGQLRDRRFILVHGNGIDLDRQRELAAGIRAKSDLALVHLHGNSTADRVAALGTIFDFSWNESQFRQQANTFEISEIGRESARNWRASVEAAPAPIRDMLRNPGLRPHFEFIFGDYLSRVADHVATWSRFFASCRPEALVAHYQAPILDVAVSAGIPSMILPHGLNYDLPQWYTGLPACRIGALSETHRNVVLGAGVDAARISVTGDPWLRRSSRKSEADRARRSLGLPMDRPIVLICTSQLGWMSANEGLPHTSWRGAIDSLLEIRALADRKPQWQFALKCHPRYDHHTLYPQLISGGNSLPIFRNESIQQLAAAADVALFANVYSSAMIECAAIGIPTVLLCNHMPGFDLDRAGLSQWPVVRSIERFEQMVEAISSSTPARVAAIEKTQLGLAHYLQGTPGDPLDAAAAQIIELTRTSRHANLSRAANG